MPAFIAVLIVTMAVGDWLWGRWALGLAARAGAGPWGRRAIQLIRGLAIASLLLVGASRLIDRRLIERLPGFVFGTTLLWHLLGLPVSLIVGLLRRGGEAIRDRARAALEGASPLPAAAADSASQSDALQLSRRAFLGRTAAVAPIVVVGAAVVRSQQTINEFEVRSMDLPIRGLPSGLDGLAIAHVSDTHLGRLTDASIFARVVRATNDLDADLVLHTGDLINDDQRDLPTAAEFVRQFRSRYGTFLCEGNHDLIGGRESFEGYCRANRLPILIDDLAGVRINGVDVELLGIPWTRPARGESVYSMLSQTVGSVAARRTPGAFPILLAHHPHAIDAAAASNIPLCLTGHTHGGQLNLTHDLGFGSLLYRYWSGTYQVGDTTGVVSNGAGNWFPLRVNAPAEIVRFTLRRA